MNITVHVNLGLFFRPKCYTQFSFNSHWFLFYVTKPPVPVAYCKDQSETFCPRNFETDASKIQHVPSNTSWTSLLFWGTFKHGHDEGETQSRWQIYTRQATVYTGNTNCDSNATTTTCKKKKNTKSTFAQKETQVQCTSSPTTV